MKQGRLTWFAPEDLDAPARALYELIAGGSRAKGPRTFALTADGGRLNGPFNAMLLSPDVGTALQELGAAIRFRSTLPDRAREIAILELAVIRQSEFEWYAHERVGLAAGLTKDEVAALLNGTTAPTLDAFETMVRDTVHRLALERTLDDAAFATAVGVLGERHLMDVIAITGYYDLLALSLAVWRTPIPPDGAQVFPTANRS